MQRHPAAQIAESSIAGSVKGNCPTTLHKGERSSHLLLRVVLPILSTVLSQQMMTTISHKPSCTPLSMEKNTFMSTTVNSKTRSPVGGREWTNHWLSEPMRVSKQGNSYHTIMRHNVLVMEDHNQQEFWDYRIADPAQHETWSPIKYRSKEDALRAALEKLATMLLPRQIPEY